MTRYYFDLLRSHESCIIDPDGSLFEDDEDAIEEAQASLRDLRYNNEDRWSDASFEIRDQDGRRIGTVVSDYRVAKSRGDYPPINRAYSASATP